MKLYSKVEEVIDGAFNKFLINVSVKRGNKMEELLTKVKELIREYATVKCDGDCLNCPIGIGSEREGSSIDICDYLGEIAGCLNS